MKTEGQTKRIISTLGGYTDLDWTKKKFQESDPDVECRRDTGNGNSFIFKFDSQNNFIKLENVKNKCEITNTKKLIAFGHDLILNNLDTHE